MANKAQHRTAFPRRSKAVGELNRYKKNMKNLKYIPLSFLLLFSQSQVYAVHKDQVLDCKDAPPAAVTKIEHKKVSNWAQVVCTKLGHVLVPQNNYIWSYYGGFAPLAFFAQGVGKNGKLQEVGHSAYFAKIKIKELNKEKSKKVAIAASFNKQLEGEIPKVYAIQAIAYNGEKHTFFIQEFS